MVDIKNQENYEKIFLAYLLYKPALNKHVQSFYFKNEYISFIYGQFKNFYAKYTNSPSLRQLWDLVKNSDGGKEISAEIFKNATSTDLGEYNEEWLDKNFEAWISSKSLDSSINEVIEYLRSTKITTENINDVVNSVKTIVNDRNNINYKFDLGLEFFE